MNFRNFQGKASISNKMILAACGIGLVLTASGQDFDSAWPFAKSIPQTTRFGISPYYGYRFGGSLKNKNNGDDYSIDDSGAYGLILSYAPLDYYGRYELLWSHQDTSVDLQGYNGLGKVDVTVDVIEIGGELEYGTQRLRGYVSAHAGATYFASDGYGDDTKFSIGFGGGVKAFLTKNIYLRGDLRGFCNVTGGEGSFIYANGVTVASFSGSTLWQGQVSAGIGFTF